MLTVISIGYLIQYR